MIDSKDLRERLDYNPNTGEFVWKKTSCFHLKIGDVAGSKKKCRGAIRNIISIDHQKYFAHRLAWLYMTGEWPLGFIDHIDGNPLNDSFKNLRDVSHKTNLQNQVRPHKSNKCGFLGVYKSGKRFLAKIRHQGKQKHLGSFATPELAHSAYVNAKRKLHEGCSI